MNDESRTSRVNPDYVRSQLSKARAATAQGSESRVSRWTQVLAGLLGGTLRVGSRTPVPATPAWVTLEVLTGGFATGTLAAGGPLLPHERALLASVPAARSAADGRTELNIHYLESEGRSELAARLRDGRYRVRVPEEAALLVATWLLERGETDRAADLVEAISPFFDRLRFYPVPHPQSLRTGDAVSVQSAGDVVGTLRAVRPQPSIAAMNEAIRIWTPLLDRAVALFLETVEEDPPRLARTEEGLLRRGANGQPVVEGGWPCRHYPADFAARARELLAEYRSARGEHLLCGKPEKPKENFARLRRTLELCVERPAALTGRDVGMIRRVLASHLTRHGAPGSDRREATRAAQLRIADLRVHHDLAHRVAEALAELPADEGLPEAELGSILQCTVPGAALPKQIAAKALRCLEAPVETLVERGLAGSSEVLAAVLPQLTARVRAGAVEDPALRRVYEANYVAFRRRRSLLLLDLESQARLSELPWLAAVEPWVGGSEASRRSGKASIARVAAVTVAGFPQTILPNQLVKELRSLAAGAGETLPFVDELAADIFMGQFAVNFLQAAKAAARLLRGTLYERYYSIPYDRVLDLVDVEKPDPGTPISPGFAALCEARVAEHAGTRRASFVARNGAILEQSQILTTHNLAVLFQEPDVAVTLEPRLPQLARHCFEWICRRRQIAIVEWRARLQMTKNTAYAFRQMVFFLSLMDAGSVATFLDWSDAHLASQRAPFRDDFATVLGGLRAAAEGRACGQPFLGWRLGPEPAPL